MRIHCVYDEAGSDSPMDAVISLPVDLDATVVDCFQGTNLRLSIQPSDLVLLYTSLVNVGPRPLRWARNKEHTSWVEDYSCTVARIL